MTYSELANFIDHGMRMSHVYQPIMIMELLANNGSQRDSEIAKALLWRDQSQVEYYTKITNNMVGRVLRKRGVVTRDRRTREFALTGFEDLSTSDIENLKGKCLRRLNEFIEKRGDQVFDHRRKSAGYISGTIRYEVLKRSKFHCELCGISAIDKALEVDHIVPRNKGGSDELSNLQTLCYSCNAMKRDRDDTDFRAVRESYGHREKGCLFCHYPPKRIIIEDELAYVLRDAFPVTEGHSLIVPKRHVSSYFELGQAEVNACTRLLNFQQDLVRKEDGGINGFNVGINVEEAAGQTIMHCHIHLIPRRNGDVVDPIGGVRNVIPGKGNYRRSHIE